MPQMKRNVAGVARESVDSLRLGWYWSRLLVDEAQAGRRSSCLLLESGREPALRHADGRFVMMCVFIRALYCRTVTVIVTHLMCVKKREPLSAEIKI